MIVRNFMIALLFLQLLTNAKAAKYWIFLDKHESLQDYKDSLSANGLQLLQTSTWFHAYAVAEKKQSINSIYTKPWVDSVQVVQQLTSAQLDKGDLQILEAMSQLNAAAFQEIGLNGRGVKIGICDAGFVNADSSQYFEHIFSENRVKAYKDFVHERPDFYEQEYKGDSHGFHVWKRIGGKLDTNYYGFAPQADFYLARTENAKTETRIEEYNWIAAIEWLDSLGVRVVSTSLGYSHLFDNKEENYAKTQMDGTQTLISKAAKIAITEKNMILIASAGNEGHKEWQIVSAPADVEEMITVGANLFPLPAKAGYSSQGPDFVNFIKPDVSCYSERGTSFSAPTIAGLVACLVQFDSSYTYKEIKKILYQSAHLQATPNNYLGYGIPDCKKIVALLEGENTPPQAIQKIESHVKKLKIELDDTNNSVLLYHKSNATHVLKQSVVQAKRKKEKKEKDSSKLKTKKSGQLVLRLKQYTGAKQTTVLVQDQIFEVYWK